MIPALIVPVLNRPELLDEMERSIDHPVDIMVVVDNGGVVPVNFGEFASAAHTRVIQPGHNLGVAASWNLGIKATATAPWWFIPNFDVTFGAGDLARMVEAMEAATGPTLVLFAGIGFSAFAINAALVEDVGLFDENLHPAYFEDNDYSRRCSLAHVEVVTLPSGIAHVGSATIHGDRTYRDQNHKTFTANKEYYIAKWGGMPGQEVHPRPFGFRLSEPAPSFSRIRGQAWRLKDVG